MFLWEAHRNLSLAIGDDALITLTTMNNNGVRYSMLLRANYLLLGTMDYLNSVLKVVGMLPKKKRNIALETWFANETVQGATMPNGFVYILNARDNTQIIPILNSTELNNFNNPQSSQREQVYVHAETGAIVGAGAGVTINYLPLPTLQNFDGTTTVAGAIPPYFNDDRHAANILSYAALRAYMDDQEIGSPERFSQFTINIPGANNALSSNQ